MNDVLLNPDHLVDVERATETGNAQWARAVLAASLALVYPSGLGGVRLSANAGPVRALWLAELERISPASEKSVVVPAAVSPERLSGGVSGAQSLMSGEIKRDVGLLERARGTCLVVNMAERLDMQVSAMIASELDGSGPEAGDGICAVLLDESQSTDEQPPAILTERLAFHADLQETPLRAAAPFTVNAADIAAARPRVLSVEVTHEIVEAVLAACERLNVWTMRAPLFCLNAAKALAALGGRDKVTADDVLRAGSLVLTSRAQAQATEAQPQQPPSPESGEDNEGAGETNTRQEEPDLEDLLVEAVETAVEAVIFSAKDHGKPDRRGVGSAGRSGETVFASDMGRVDRPSRSRGRGNRVDLVATLRAAAPMQRLREQPPGQPRPKIKPADLRMKRFRRRKQSSVIFVVDASGSAAMHRMSEAKGAVQKLLSDCYSRRDLVSLIAFRGEDAELLLPPTRSLVSAHRRLSDLPGGGATPLARAITTAGAMAEAERARGRSPFLVFLSDGRGNMTLDGKPDRAVASEETTNMARRLSALSVPTVFFDTSRRPTPQAKALSVALGAAYEFLPIADSGKVSGLVREHIGYN